MEPTTNKSSNTGKQKKCKKNGNITCDQQKRNSNVQMNRRIWTFESTMHCIVRCAIYTTHTHTHTLFFPSIGFGTLKGYASIFYQ